VIINRQNQTWKTSDIRGILVYKREPRRIRRGSVSPEGEFMVF